jgi:hypothetical protein
LASTPALSILFYRLANPAKLQVAIARKLKEEFVNEAFSLGTLPKRKKVPPETSFHEKP